MNSIFYRTYWKDARWLLLSLESVERHVTGFDNIVVTLPHSSLNKMDHEGIAKRFPFTRWIPVDEHCRDDYMGQQATKMHADRWTGPGRILFVDSDCVFHTATTPETFLVDGKIEWLHTPYEDMPPSHPWRAPTTKFIEHPVEYEFMRRLPMMVESETVRFMRDFCARKHGMSIEAYLRSVEDKDGRYFSEFNALGAFAWHFQRDLYTWTNTRDKVPPSVARQFWSWGGIDSAKQEIEALGFRA